MADNWRSLADKPDARKGPARRAVAVTPADSDLTDVTRAVYVGGAGNLAVLLAEDATPVVFTAVPVGTWLWIQAKQIRSTSTTATAIVALY